MQKDFLIVVENKKFGNLKQNIMGFYYGKSFMTLAGCDLMIEQSKLRGEKPDPALIAGMQAIKLKKQGKYSRPLVVSAMMKRLKLPFNQDDLRDGPAVFELASSVAKPYTPGISSDDGVKLPHVEVFKAEP